MKSTNMRCVAVHTPYSDIYGDRLDLGKSSSSSVILGSFPYVLKICNSILEETGFIIYHMGNDISMSDTNRFVTSLDRVRNKPLLEFKVIVSLLTDQLVNSDTNKFKIAIENVIPFENRLGEIKYNVIGNGYNNLTMVKELKENGNDKVYCVLDTCHFGASQFIMNDIRSIGNVIQDYKECLAIVHSSSGNNITLHSSSHGLVFSDKALLEDILTSVCHIGDDVILTLEVIKEIYEGENSFTNLKKVYKMCDNIFSKIYSPKRGFKFKREG